MKFSSEAYNNISTRYNNIEFINVMLDSREREMIIGAMDNIKKIDNDMIRILPGINDDLKTLLRELDNLIKKDEEKKK